MQRTPFYLTQAQYAALITLAKETGKAQDQLLRQTIVEFLKKHKGQIAKLP